MRFDELDEYDPSSTLVEKPGDEAEVDVTSNEDLIVRAAADNCPPEEFLDSSNNGQNEPEESVAENESQDLVPDGDNHEHTPPNDPPPDAPRRSTSKRRGPGAWWASVATCATSSHPPSNESSISLISCDKTSDPRSFAEATSGPLRVTWMKSMKNDCDSLMENQCWELIPRPADSNVIRSIWV